MKGSDKMKARIRQIRKDSGLTQENFGKRIGVKANTVTNYELGLRTPTEAVILSICREFKINENWLKNGIGEMKIPMTRSQQVELFANEIMVGFPNENFKKRFIKSIAKLTKDEWEMILEKIMEYSKK